VHTRLSEREGVGVGEGACPLLALFAGFAIIAYTYIKIERGCVMFCRRRVNSLGFKCWYWLYRRGWASMWELHRYI